MFQRCELADAIILPTSMASSVNNSTCRDILEFQSLIKSMRILDDKIIYALNTSLPTDSFKGKVDGAAGCKDLYQQLQTNYLNRENSIKGCIEVLTDDLLQLKQQRSNKPDEVSLNVQYRKNQMTLRVLRTELSVEEVIKERSLTVFQERCRDFFKPSDQ